MAQVVRGIRELNLAFARAGSSVHKDKDILLRFYARPVEQTAEQLALSNISHNTIPWAQMRLGSTPNMVYIAPQQRGTRLESRKRRRFARILLSRAMVPALNQNRDRVARGLDELLARLERRWGR